MGFIDVPWPVVNKTRNYPFTQDSTLISGAFRLPNDFIVDLVMSVNADVTPTIDPSAFYLMNIGIFPNGVNFTIGYLDQAAVSISISKQSFIPYTTISFTGINDFYDARGFITIGSLDSISTYPGAYSFTVDTARILPTVIRPNIRAVTSLSIENNGGVSVPVTGDITFVPGSNMNIQLAQNEDLSWVITFNALSATGFNEECECTGVDTLSQPIRTINGIPPDFAGNLAITGSSCLVVNNETAGINIEDVCSVPCCGCDELEVVTETLTRLMNESRQVDEAVRIAIDAVDNIRTNLIASRVTTVPPSEV